MQKQKCRSSPPFPPDCGAEKDGAPGTRYPTLRMTPQIEKPAEAGFWRFFYSKFRISDSGVSSFRFPFGEVL